MLYQYNNIYVGSYKYLKGKKSTKKKKKNQQQQQPIATIATMPLKQTKVAL